MPRGEYSNNEVTLVPGFLRGFRAWGLGLFNDAPTLTGTIQTGYVWQPGRNEADCLVRSYGGRGIVHPCPSPKCSCGLYARYLDRHHRYVGVTGIIKVTGDIVLGTAGFRAQYAEIEALYLDDEALQEYLTAVRIAGRFPIGLGRVRIDRPSESDFPAWGKASNIVELVAARYGVKVYPSAAEAQAAFPFPSVEGLIPSEPEPEPDIDPYSSAWWRINGPLIWGPPLSPSAPLSPYRGERKKLKPVPLSPRHWRTK